MPSARRGDQPKWAGRKWKDRVRLLEGGGQHRKRVFGIGAVMSLEVGRIAWKRWATRETADLIYYSCDSMERNDGYMKPMNKDPLVGYIDQRFDVRPTACGW